MNCRRHCGRMATHRRAAFVHIGVPPSIEIRNNRNYEDAGDKGNVEGSAPEAF